MIERMCTACHQRQPRERLLRFVVDSRGHLRFDPAGKQAGRGVYVCPERRCIRLAATRSGFARGLRRGVAAVDPDRLAALVVEELSATEGAALREGLADGRARFARRSTRSVEPEGGGERISVEDEKLWRYLEELRTQVRRLQAQQEPRRE